MEEYTRDSILEMAKAIRQEDREISIRGFFQGIAYVVAWILFFAAAIYLIFYY